MGGCLLGAAVGDALGLPAEGLSPGRIRRRWQGAWRMRLLPGIGMLSDDTEHHLMVAQALLEESADPDRFQQVLASKLRWWFASLPAGIGMATARACMKLWLGFRPRHAGVESGGSAPAMRSAIIGVHFASDPDRRRRFVDAATTVTHQGWQARVAANAVAEVAAMNASTTGKPTNAAVLERLRSLSAEPEWRLSMDALDLAATRCIEVGEFARLLRLDAGVTGYALHVVPVALFAWMRHPDDFRRALVAVIECGGDTDTAGAVLGAIHGAASGPGTIPTEWIAGIRDWPRSTGFIRSIASRLAIRDPDAGPHRQVPLCWPAIPVRNAFFLAVILAHGLRRLAPPY